MNNSLINEDGRDCSKCKAFKIWDEYSRTKATRTGYQSRCKLCSSKGAKKYVRRKPKGSVFAPEPGFSSLAQCFYLSKRC